MELTLDQALQKGVEAHRAGNVQEADRYYTAILKANSKHPDANHNMGVLAVGLGKVQEALPFFKAALEANPNLAQYWLSYIDALIKLERMDEAKVVFDQAKSKGATGEGFDQIEERFGLSDLKKSNDLGSFEDELKSLLGLYNRDKLQQVFEKAQILTKRYGKSLQLWNLMGASAAQIGKLDQAVNAFQKAISIKPGYAPAFNNIGNVFKVQGKLKQAKEAYIKAISLKPDYADAYNNMGIIFIEQGKQEQAIESYIKAISLKPDYAEAFNNLSNCLTGVIFSKPNKPLQKTIVSILDRKTYVRPNEISKAAISLLKFEPTRR